MLTAEDVVAYLISRRLLTSADVVDGEIVVTDVSRRHQNFAISRAGGNGLFVKQHDFRQNARTLGREAQAYESLGRSAPEFARNHTPVLLSHDTDIDTLVLQLLGGVESLSSMFHRLGDAAVSSATRLGSALAILHDLAPADAISAPTPWVFSALLPPSTIMDEFSTIGLSAIAIIQQMDSFRHSLPTLRLGHEFGFVHGDMRLENCLVRTSEDTTLAEALYLVDWELSGIGDTSADVGGILCDYLTIWLRSIPSAPTVPIADSISAASLSLNSVRPSTEAFWNAYRERRTSWSGAQDFVLRSLRWAGMRLAQAAVEEAQSCGALTTSVVLTLQLADNMLSRPVEAGSHLLGISGL